MSISLNCLVLGDTSFDSVFSVEINGDANRINNMKVTMLKKFIFNEIKNKLSIKGIKDPVDLRLWKVDIGEGCKLDEIKSEEDIKKLPDSRMMQTLEKLGDEPNFPFDKKLVDNHIHVIVVPFSKEKTFYIQAYDKEGNPILNQYDLYNMKSENEFDKFLRRIDAKGLGFFDSVGIEHVVTSLDSIDNDMKYHINSSYLSAIKSQITWTQIEDRSIEEETSLALQNSLNKIFKSSVRIFKSRIMFNEKKIAIMEWDGIMVVDDKVFLCETKHNMTLDHINNLRLRLKEFPNKLLFTKDDEFQELMNKNYFGVACASFFPESLRSVAIELGIITVYPSGNRFIADFPDHLIKS
ncbi:hypothetical protein RclHR1_04130003 [Rhizophagus clarus]|uniref:P-loop containing nucleoside triphosphate hydrolase protein n=1 Tax=Rhizophagus clarus TaxID=94130 RepID=A0A2Z6S9L9_9GLOM|nr:hypothetical protein RclHR1_04130003 [Rhizophagus clarus]GES86566.1 P-loop containing nucleoside triphosphate hydrolase protein [Rhizophagus clarus]